MTNPIAIFLGSIIIVALTADVILTDASNIVFVAIKFTEMTEWMAFWR